MKVFIGGELEQSISDKFRKARNSVIESMKCLYDIPYIDELSFYVFCMKGFATNPVSRYSKKGIGSNWKFCSHMTDLKQQMKPNALIY